MKISRMHIDNYNLTLAYRTSDNCLNLAIARTDGTIVTKSIVDEVLGVEAQGDMFMFCTAEQFGRIIFYLTYNFHMEKA